MTKQKKILLGALIALAALLILFFAVIRPLTSGDGESSTLEPIPILEGESYYGKNGVYNTQLPVLFPIIERSDIFQVRVKNDETDYLFYHEISSAASDSTNYFRLGLYNDGDIAWYTPEISRYYYDFDYTSLYDETSRIPTMIVATGSVFFKDRAYVRAHDESNPDDAAFEAILAEYGLSKADDPAYYEILSYEKDKNGNYLYESYTDGSIICVRVGEDGTTSYYYANTVVETEEGYDYSEGVLYTGALSDIHPIADLETNAIRVYVGDRTADDTGYYLYVEGRDVVYTTGTGSVGDVVYRDMSYYVQPRLITEAESVYTPHIPAGFRIWNLLGSVDSASEASAILYRAGALTAFNSNSEQAASGIFRLMTGELDVHLSDALRAVSKGDVVDLSVFSEYPLATPLKEGNSYDYSFYAVTAVIGSLSVNRTEGRVVADGELVMVSYRMAEAGEAAEGEMLTAVVDLSDPYLPAAIRAALVGKAVSPAPADPATATPIATATVTYDESVIDRFTCTYSIDAILGIAASLDESGVPVGTVTKEGTMVPSSGYALVNYTTVIEGVRYNETVIVNLAGEESFLLSELRRAVVGKKVGVQTGLSISVDFPYDPMLGYLIYEDTEILDILAYEEELSFSYISPSERDIFNASNIYGIYGPDDKKIYTLDDTVVGDVLPRFEDLLGDETIAVGITNELIEKYGLTANIFYYEMPFGLREVADSEERADYAWDYTIGYYLYLSEPIVENGVRFRYAASTMYDTIVKISADPNEATNELYSDDVFDFVDWDFREKWVRRNILQLAIANVDYVTFTLNYSDLRESHSFDLTVNPNYKASDGDGGYIEQNRIYVSYIEGDKIYFEKKRVDASDVETDSLNNSTTTKYYTQSGILVEPYSGSFYQVTKSYGADGKPGVNIDQIYDDADGIEGNLGYSGVDFEGVLSFKDLFTRIYLTQYGGVIRDSELDRDAREALVANPNALLFEMRFALVDGREYTLGFYRYSEGRCLVRLADLDAGIVGDDFFISAYEVKNLAFAVQSIVAGKQIDTEHPWITEDQNG